MFSGRLFLTHFLSFRDLPATGRTVIVVNVIVASAAKEKNR